MSVSVRRRRGAELDFELLEPLRPRRWDFFRETDGVVPGDSSNSEEIELPEYMEDLRLDSLEIEKIINYRELGDRFEV